MVVGTADFRLKANKGDVLTVSYIGMKKQEVKATANHTRVVLENDNASLDEVVVVGYGQQKKVSVVGAITQTSGKVLERSGGVNDLGTALTGNRQWSRLRLWLCLRSHKRALEP